MQFFKGCGRVIHFIVFRNRLVKNCFAVPKSVRGFRQTAPHEVYVPLRHKNKVRSLPEHLLVIELLVVYMTFFWYKYILAVCFCFKITQSPSPEEAKWSTTNFK